MVQNVNLESGRGRRWRGTKCSFRRVLVKRRVKGAKPWASLASGGLATAPDKLGQRRNERLAGDAQTAAQIIPERHGVLCTGLGKAEEGITAIASGVTAGSAADLAAGDLAADVVLGAVSMQWDFRPVQHHQQLGLVGVEPLQQAIQRNESGAVAEDAIEPGAQHHTAALAGIGPINLEIGVEVPDQLTNVLLSRTVQIRERVQLVHQPFVNGGEKFPRIVGQKFPTSF
jgi:hypothetical protein